MGTLKLMEHGSEQLRDVLAESAERELRREKRGRGILSDTKLMASMWDLIEGFEQLLALPVTTLSVKVESQEVEEAAPVDLRPDTVMRLNELLESVRRLRETNRGLSAQNWRRALAARKPELSKVFEGHFACALERLNEWEQFLILLGAGDEADAGLGASLVPAIRDDAPTGASLPFDL